MTDAERASIDAEAKTILRQLYSAVERISQVEQIRQDTESQVALRKRAQGGLGGLGRWAAGGVITAKSIEEEEIEARQKMLSAHREGVIWFLQRRLQEAGTLQGSMMETRIQREVEKSKSVLYKSRGGSIPYDKTFAGDDGYGKAATSGGGDDRARQELSQEQLQLFAQENQDMLKHYEDTLDQVRLVVRVLPDVTILTTKCRTAEKSLLEISELQTTLVTNLAMQSEHIDQLVQDSFLTTENVGRGNKELKRASERPSTARMLFHGTCAFCTFLIVWDLIF